MYFKNFLDAHDILQRLTCPYHPEHNGLAEHKHRHIVEIGLTLLAQSSLPTPYWVEAFHTAKYIINHLPAHRLLQNLSPYEKLFKKSPQYNFFKVFGCECYPYLRSYNNNKLQFYSKHCVFLGYSLNHHGYRCLDPFMGHVFISRQVVFDEYIFPYQESILTSLSSLSSSMDPVIHIGPSPSLPLSPLQPTIPQPAPTTQPHSDTSPATFPQPAPQHPLLVYICKPKLAAQPLNLPAPPPTDLPPSPLSSASIPSTPRGT